MALLRSFADFIQLSPLIFYVGEIKCGDRREDEESDGACLSKCVKKDGPSALHAPIVCQVVERVVLIARLSGILVLRRLNADESHELNDRSSNKRESEHPLSKRILLYDEQEPGQGSNQTNHEAPDEHSPVKPVVLRASHENEHVVDKET